MTVWILGYNLGLVTLPKKCFWMQLLEFLKNSHRWDFQFKNQSMRTINHGLSIVVLVSPLHRVVRSTFLTHGS